ncbi:hypothetical protein B0H34DRAFT_392258 [Crassisporium funariophilum]|nr:hypothetical protein B0H34DRAFT_392258 [Crassisporium funariophilum]
MMSTEGSLHTLSTSRHCNNQNVNYNDSCYESQHETTTIKTKPRFFTTSQNRAILDDQTLNKSLSSDLPGALSLQSSKQLDGAGSSGTRMLDFRTQSGAVHQQVGQSDFLSSSQAPKRKLFAGIPRTSTPTTSSHASQRNQEDVARSSSPFTISHPSPERAYMNSNKQQLISLDEQTISHMSSLRHPFNVSVSRTEPRQEPTICGIDDDVILQNIHSWRNSMLSKNQHLDNENAQLALRNTQLTQDLAASKTLIKSTSSQLASSTAELTRLRPELTSARESLVAAESELGAVKTHLEEAKAEAGVANGERARLTEAHAQDRAENDQLRKRAEHLKKAIASQRELSEALGSDLKSLGKANHALTLRLNEVVREKEDIVKLARSGLAALEPLIDPTETLARAAETKSVHKSLQDDLAASERVTDLLRDKLHNQSFLLAESRDRVRELEEEKRSSLGDFLLHGREEERMRVGLLADVEGKVEELTERLMIRERTTLDVLVNSSAVEAKLEVVSAEFGVMKNLCDMNSAEVEGLRVVKEESLSKLLSAQEVINAREKEIVGLKMEVKALIESKDELRALMAEAKKNLAEKEAELRAKDPNVDLESKIQALTVQVTSLTLNLSESESRFDSCRDVLKTREMELKAKVHEAERAEMQMAAFKTMAAKVQDELNDELKASCAREANIIGKYDSSLETNRELKERLEVQSGALFQAKEDCAKYKATLISQVTSLEAALATAETTSGNLVKSQSQRAVSAEMAASALKAQLDDAVKDVFELTARLKQVDAELVETRNAMAVRVNEMERATNMDRVRVGEEERVQELDMLVQELQAKLRELETRNGVLEVEKRQIVGRYKSGKLTHVENDFVGLVISETQSAHEMDVIEKSNELRRRENQIEGLKTKVVEMELTIARLIKEREKQTGLAATKPIVSLKRWLPSSPEEALMVEDDVGSPPMAQHEVSDSTKALPSNIIRLPANKDKEVVVTPSSAPYGVANPSAPSKPVADPKFSLFDDLSEGIDSEDDTPLSELSEVSWAGGNKEDSRAGTTAGAGGTKRARSPEPLVVAAVDDQNRFKRRTRTSTGAQLALTLAPVTAAVAMTTLAAPKKTTTMEGNSRSRQKKRK